MSERMDIFEVAPDGFRAVLGLEGYASGRIDHDLYLLLKVRASMVNSCAFCVDMHTTDWIEGGADPRKVFAVAAWEESPFFSERERTVLALTDAVTRLSEGGVSDGLWAEANKELGDELLADMLIAIAAINVWNRLAAPTHKSPPPLAA